MRTVLARATIATAFAVLLAGLAGCGGDGDSGNAAANPTGSATAPSGADCKGLLSTEDVANLMGEAATDPVERPFSSLTACRWDAADDDTWVQVLDFRAAEWAKVLPEAIGVARDSAIKFEGREKIEVGLKLIEEGGELDDRAACELFTTMIVGLQGAEPGSNQIVNYLPGREAPLAVNAQSCIDGRYTSVLLVKAGLTRSTELEATIQGALESVG